VQPLFGEQIIGILKEHEAGDDLIAATIAQPGNQNATANLGLDKTRGKVSQIASELSTWAAGRAVSAGKSIPYFDVVHPLIQWQSPAGINLR
jgi:hypothetical protein